MPAWVLDSMRFQLPLGAGAVTAAGGVEGAWPATPAGTSSRGRLAAGSSGAGAACAAWAAAARRCAGGGCAGCAGWPACQPPQSSSSSSSSPLPAAAACVTSSCPPAFQSPVFQPPSCQLSWFQLLLFQPPLEFQLSLFQPPLLLDHWGWPPFCAPFWPSSVTAIWPCAAAMASADTTWSLVKSRGFRGSYCFMNLLRSGCWRRERYGSPCHGSFTRSSFKLAKTCPKSGGKGDVASNHRSVAGSRNLVW
mmetsp:Transcript_13170/g.31164  ORF Transcript_13170/g.31164 Transcript_13170/m.31164 type:complete len:250 (+) Transcript_13170:117-866(+)